MGHRSRGSWVISLFGQMGHGSQCDLLSAKYGTANAAGTEPRGDMSVGRFDPRDSTFSLSFATIHSDKKTRLTTLTLPTPKRYGK